MKELNFNAEIIFTKLPWNVWFTTTGRIQIEHTIDEQITKDYTNFTAC